MPYAATSYLPKHSADKVVMWDVIFVNLLHIGIGIKYLVSGQFKKASVGIKSCFEDLVVKFTKKSTAVDASFVHACRVH